MRAPVAQPDWPESWKLSHAYDLQEIFGKIANRGYTYGYRRRFDETLRMVQSVAPPPATILDIAAAQGNFSLALAERGYEVTWNDLREELADYVRLKHERGQVRYAPGNVFELGFAEPFDVVLITEIIEHVAHPDEFLAKVATLVKPGGHVVMTTPNGGALINRLSRFSDCSDPSVFEAVQFKPNADGHIFLLHHDEIAALAEKAGLRVRRIELFSNLLTNGFCKTERLLHLLPRALVSAIESATGHLPFALKNKVNCCLGVIFQRPPVVR